MRLNKRISEEELEDIEETPREERKRIRLEDPLEEQPLDDTTEEEDDLFKEDLELDNDFDMFDGGQVAMEKHHDLLKSLTDFGPYLKSTLNSWLAVRWNEEQKAFMKDPEIEQIMNVKGATWAISFITTYARNNNILTNISQKEYNWIIEDIIDTIWLNIGCRAEEFGITSNGNILRVCNEMEHAAELVLMGAGDGKYTEFLGKSVQRSENVQVIDGQISQGMAKHRPPQGWLGKMKHKLLGQQT